MKTMPSEIIAETCPAPECNLLPADVVQCIEELEDYALALHRPFGVVNRPSGPAST